MVNARDIRQWLSEFSITIESGQPWSIEFQIHTGMVCHTKGKFSNTNLAECFENVLECVKTFLSV